MTDQERLFERLPPSKLFLKFALPSMVSMAVTSLYTVADGVLVGRFLGADALAAVNLVMPIIMISFALADMVAVGSSVQIAIHLGAKREEEASRIFTVCSALIVAISCVVGVLGSLLAQPVVRLMGADETVTAMAAEYLKVYAVFAPLIMVFFAADNYLRICGRPRYSMALNVVTSLLNIGLDILFLWVWRLGIGSAALASCLSLALGTVLSYLPFLRKTLPLRFVRGWLKPVLVGNILANGASEFFSTIARSVMMLALNSVLLHLSGSMAVAAFSVVLYVDSVTGSLLYGLADSMQPPISYCYGAGLPRRMLALEKRVLGASAALSLGALALMWLGGGGLVALFIQPGETALLAMSIRAMRLFALSYLAGWLGMSLSSFFTAVNRPGISLVLSLCRALGFPMLMLAVLPRWLGLDGVWLTSPAADVLTALLAVAFLAVVIRTPRSRDEV